MDRIPLIKDIHKVTQINNIPKFIQKYNLLEIINDAKFTLKLVDQIKQDKLIFTSSSLYVNRGEWFIIKLPDSSSEAFTHYANISKTTIPKWQDPILTFDKLVDRLREVVSDTLLKVINEKKDTL